MTETIDKLYLELSNVTNARNNREQNMAMLIVRLVRIMPKSLMHSSLPDDALDYLRRAGMLDHLSTLRGDGQ